VQGYHFAPPLLPEQFVDTVEASLRQAPVQTVPDHYFVIYVSRAVRPLTEPSFPRSSRSVRPAIVRWRFRVA